MTKLEELLQRRKNIEELLKHIDQLIDAELKKNERSMYDLPTPMRRNGKIL